jgi:sarcosine oxidase subunit alpha
VLLAEGVTAFNVTRGGKPRGIYCNMGTCFECQVQVTDAGSSDVRWLRACISPVEAGMAVTTGVRPLQNSDHAEG